MLRNRLSLGLSCPAKLDHNVENGPVCRFSSSRPSITRRVVACRTLLKSGESIPYFTVQRYTIVKAPETTRSDADQRFLVKRDIDVDMRRHSSALKFH